MNRFFNYDNGIMQTLSKIFDCICINLLWLVCCIPIFTIGASSSAYYYAYNKAIRQRRSYACREFFHGLKLNFKQSTKAWLLVFFLYVVTLMDCRILGAMAATVKYAGVLQAVILAMFVLITMWVTYLFPYMARFEAGTKAVIKNCAIIMVANLPWSLLLLVLFAATVFAFVIFPGLGMLFAPIIYMVFANLILERVFRKYMTPEDLEAEKEIDMYK